MRRKPIDQKWIDRGRSLFARKQDLKPKEIAVLLVRDGYKSDHLCADISDILMECNGKYYSQQCVRAWLTKAKLFTPKVYPGRNKPGRPKLGEESKSKFRSSLDSPIQEFRNHHAMKTKLLKGSADHFSYYPI